MRLLLFILLPLKSHFLRQFSIFVVAQWELHDLARLINLTIFIDRLVQSLPPSIESTIELDPLKSELHKLARHLPLRCTYIHKSLVRNILNVSRLIHSIIELLRGQDWLLQDF